MKNKISLAIFILQFAFMKILAQDEPIILVTPTGGIEGSLLLPEKREVCPVVLIIAGSGPTDRNGNNSEMENNSLKMLAQEFQKRGVASLRFDKRGIGQSSDAGRDQSELRFDTYVNDVKAWVDMLAKDKRFSKIIIAGHSEGSLIGIVASVKNKKVAALISIAGAGRPADVIIKEQLSGAPENIQLALFRMLDRVKKGDTISSVPPIFYPILHPSVQPYMTSWFKYDPAIEIKKLNIPILILQGSTDVQVKELDAEQLAKAAPTAIKKTILNMNHVLKDCDTMDKEKQKPIYSEPTYPLNQEFCVELVAFLDKVVKKK